MRVWHVIVAEVVTTFPPHLPTPLDSNAFRLFPPPTPFFDLRHVWYVVSPYYMAVLSPCFMTHSDRITFPLFYDTPSMHWLIWTPLQAWHTSTVLLSLCFMTHYKCIMSVLFYDTFQLHCAPLFYDDLSSPFLGRARKWWRRYIWTR